MLVKILKIALLFCVISISAVAETESLRIMTYNVPRSNDYITPEGVNTYENRAKALAECINKVKPDVLGMQEPTFSDLWVFLKLIPGYSMLGVARNDGVEKGQYTLILYRTDKYVVEHDGIYFLSKTPDVLGSKDWGSECQRLATWGIFRNKKTQARFFYTNTHLDHISDSARTNQMAVIKTKMSEISAKYGTMPMMITGDFNVSSTASGAYTNATKMLIPMNDAWQVAKRKEGLTYTHPSFEWPSHVKIDYIMLSKDITVETAYIGNSFTETGTIISDHNPHWADITWNTRTTDVWDKVIYDAQAALDSTKVFTTGTTKLITNATEGSAGCQVTYDTKENDSSTDLKYLIDGNRNTYFRSSWSGTNPYNPHYFEVDLKQAYQYLHFTYGRAGGSTSTVTGNCWVDMMITGSNDKVNWEYITEYCDINTDDKLQTFPTFAMYKPFRYLRFNTMRTPDMKIRHSYPQYVIGEFQIYADKINENTSPCYTNPEIKNAAEQLQTVLDETRNAKANATLNAEKIEELQRALYALRNVNVDKGVLQALINECSQLMITFSTGKEYGQVTSNDLHQFNLVITEARTAINTLILKSELDEAYNKLEAAKQTFLTARKTFETNKWYYVQCQHLTNNVQQANYGKVLCIEKQEKGTLLKNGFYENKTFTGSKNAAAMWRIIPLGNNTYALQNRATGGYLGGNNAEYHISDTPVALNIELKGVTDFHISLADSAEQYVTALADSTIAITNGGYHSAAAWVFNAVEDDSLGTIQLPVLHHHIQLITLPYALQIKPSEEVTTYTLVRMPKTGVFQLRKKNDFEAGEPFFILTGKANELDANCTEMVYADILPPDSFTTETKTVNGVHGILASVNPNKTLYYVSGNTLHMARVSVAANTGYIIRTEIKDLGGLANIAYSNAEGIVEIVNAGDINDDANINASDLTLLVSMIMSSTEVNGNKATQSADLNEDNQINAVDLTELVNKIME